MSEQDPYLAQGRVSPSQQLTDGDPNPSVKRAFKSRLNASVGDTVFIISEYVRLNEEGFVPVENSGVVSFKQKYMYDDAGEDEINNSKVVFGSMFHKKSGFTIDNPKPPCGPEEYGVLQKGLQKRLEVLRKEIRHLHKTTDDSVMTRTAVEHAQKLIALINSIDKKRRENPDNCEPYDPDNHFVSVGLSGVNDDSIKDLYAAFSYIVLQHLRPGAISNKHKQPQFRIDPTEFIKTLVSNSINREKVLEYAKELKGGAPQDSLPSEIALILLTNIDQLLSESNLQLLKKLTSTLGIQGNTVEEIIDNLKKEYDRHASIKNEHDDTIGSLTNQVNDFQGEVENKRLEIQRLNELKDGLLRELESNKVDMSNNAIKDDQIAELVRKLTEVSGQLESANGELTRAKEQLANEERERGAAIEAATEAATKAATEAAAVAAITPAEQAQRELEILRGRIRELESQNAQAIADSEATAAAEKKAIAVMQSARDEFNTLNRKSEDAAAVVAAANVERDQAIRNKEAADRNAAEKVAAANKAEEARAEAEKAKAKSNSNSAEAQRLKDEAIARQRIAEDALVRQRAAYEEALQKEQTSSEKQIFHQQTKAALALQEQAHDYARKASERAKETAAAAAEAAAASKKALEGANAKTADAEKIARSEGQRADSAVAEAAAARQKITELTGQLQEARREASTAEAVANEKQRQIVVELERVSAAAKAGDKAAEETIGNLSDQLNAQRVSSAASKAASAKKIAELEKSLAQARYRGEEANAALRQKLTEYEKELEKCNITTGVETAAPTKVVVQKLSNQQTNTIVDILKVLEAVKSGKPIVGDLYKMSDYYDLFKGVKIRPDLTDNNKKISLYLSTVYSNNPSKIRAISNFLMELTFSINKILNINNESTIKYLNELTYVKNLILYLCSHPDSNPKFKAMFHCKTSGGSIDSLSPTLERLEDKIKEIRTVYIKTVKKLLKSLESKGYIVKDSSEIPTDDIEEILTSIMKDLEEGSLTEAIESLPPVEENLDGFQSISGNLEGTKLEKMKNLVKSLKSDTSELNASHNRVRGVRRMLKNPRKRAPVYKDLLKNFPM
jgi:hypothetical protein